MAYRKKEHKGAEHLNVFGKQRFASSTFSLPHPVSKVFRDNHKVLR